MLLVLQPGRVEVLADHVQVQMFHRWDHVEPGAKRELPAHHKAVVTGSDGGLEVALLGARLVLEHTSMIRFRAAWDMLVGAVGPAHKWPPHTLDKAILGSTKDGHLDGKARFSLTVFLVLNGASPEIVYEYYAAAQLLEGGDKASFVRWDSVVGVVATIMLQQCGVKPATLTFFDTRLGARVGVDGKYTNAEPWVARLEREAAQGIVRHDLAACVARCVGSEGGVGGVETTKV